jgi:hypothetical protein
MWSILASRVIWSRPGRCFILDAETGAYTYGISLFGYLPKPFRPLYANCIRFTPTGEKAYIGSGRQDKYPGTICVIKTRTHAIEKMIWPDFEHYICYMEIGPKR